MHVVLMFAALLCSSLEIFGADIGAVEPESYTLRASFIKAWVEKYKENPPEGYMFLLAAKTYDGQYLVVYTKDNEQTLKINMGPTIAKLSKVAVDNCRCTRINDRVIDAQATLTLGGVLGFMSKRKKFAYVRCDLNEGVSRAILDKRDWENLHLEIDPRMSVKAWLKLLAVRED